MLNNKAMVLYDALIGFIVLSTTASVFIKILECDYKLIHHTKDTIVVLNALKEGSMSKNETQFDDHVQESNSAAQYCVSYNKISRCLDK